MSNFFGIFNRSIDEDDANIYAKVEEEIESGEIDRGMWSQALVMADGNEQRRKAEYMKLRVSKLKRQPQKTSTIISSFSLSSPEEEKVEVFNREAEPEKNYKGIGRTAFILSSIGSIFSNRIRIESCYRFWGRSITDRIKYYPPSHCLYTLGFA